MLQTAYFLTKFGLDTAENEPLEVWEKLLEIIQYYSIVFLIATPPGEVLVGMDRTVSVGSMDEGFLPKTALNRSASPRNR